MNGVIGPSVRVHAELVYPRRPVSVIIRHRQTVDVTALENDADTASAIYKSVDHLPLKTTSSFFKNDFYIVLQPCPADAPSYRATQCSSFDQTPYKGDNHTWLPVQMKSI